MQDFNRSEWFATEHNRLHSVEMWPDGARKEAALSAIRSALDSLSRHPGVPEAKFNCMLCQNRKKPDVRAIGARPNLDSLIALLPTGS